MVALVFNKNWLVALNYYRKIHILITVTLFLLLDGYGNISAVFQMYTDGGYGRVHSYYPVNAQLRDWLYLEIFANVADNSVVVLVDECFATPTMDLNYHQKSVFIKNG